MNRGTDVARQITSYIKNTGKLKLVSANKTFIGDCDVGSIIPVSYSFKIPVNTTSGEKLVTILLLYKDSYNNNHTFTFDLPIQITPKPPVKKERKITGLDEILISGSVVAVVISYFFGKGFFKKK